ncbi:hypothetical protein ALT1644_240019 [Alteromonas macleodii]
MLLEDCVERFWRLHGSQAKETPNIHTFAEREAVSKVEMRQYV